MREHFLAIFRVIDEPLMGGKLCFGRFFRPFSLSLRWRKERLGLHMGQDRGSRLGMRFSC